MRFFSRMIIGLLALALTGCQQGSPHKTTVRFWNGFTGPDGRTMLRLVKRFNEQNPDVQVVMQRMDWATYYNKLFVAGMGHRAPSVYVVHTRAMNRFARAGFARPNDDLVNGPNGIDTKDLDSNVWQAVSFGGQHYGLPLDVHVLGMYYNRRLFREAGIVDEKGNPKPPTNREEFLDAARRLTVKGRNGKPDQWGFVFTNFESNTYTVLRQFGGEFFTPDGSQCVLNNPDNVEGLQFCTDLIRKYHVAPNPENIDSWIGFRQGKIAMAFEGIYMLADLEKQKDLDFAGAPVPQMDDHTRVWADSHNLCLRPDLEGKELDAAWRFVKFLSDNSLDWAQGGQVPVRKSLRHTERFRKMEVQSQFARQIPYVTYLPSLPFVFEFQTEYGHAIERSLRGTDTPQRALAVAQTNINRIIARDRAVEAQLARKDHPAGPAESDIELRIPLLPGTARANGQGSIQ